MNEPRKKIDRKKIYEPNPVSNDVEYGTFISKLRIDKHGLDNELMEQPSIYHDIADRLAEARSIRDMVKDNLKTLESSLTLEYRSSGEKMTEKYLSDLVQVSKRRKAAFNKLVEADREVARWEALKDSYKDRSYMLKELCELFISSYSMNSTVTNTDSMKKEFKAETAKAAMKALRDQRRK